MTHINIDLDSINWEPFLQAQEGGGSVDATRYFQGTRYQRGVGILGTVGRFLLPIVKNLATTAGSQAVKMGQNVLEDVAKGRSVQEALTAHGKEGFKNVAERLQQCGKGKRRKRKLPPAKATKDPMLPASATAFQPPRKRQYRDQLSQF
jgi:hypothetical protein